MTDYSKITALYSRLSVGDEDRDGGESNSIQNQKIFLENYARGQHLTNIRHYIDDDESGRFFDRSAYSRMMDDVENGKIGVCIMKDLTRWGRDYLQVGNAMEIFRRNNVRFIAVNNGIDSEKPDTLEFAPFINIMSEWYAKDISKKVKTGIKTKGMSGKPIVTEAPYGYVKDPDNKDFWIIDEEAAEVVRLIFRLFIGGKNRNQIAVHLKNEQIPTPTFYMKDRGRGTCKNKTLNEDNRCKWNKATLTNILTRQEYCGDVVNFKTTKHFRDKHNHYVDRSQWHITENVHEPIISRSDFETVQRILENAPVRRPNGDGEIHPLSGLLFCKDCGAKMHIRIDYRNGGKRHVAFCSEYHKGKAKNPKCHSPHIMDADLLMQTIAEVLKKIEDYSISNRAEFEALVKKNLAMQQTDQTKKQQKRIPQITTRLEQIDKVLNKLYEDNALGAISQDRYEQMSQKYSEEYYALKAELATLQEQLSAYENAGGRAQKFLKLTERHAAFTELTPAMVDGTQTDIMAYNPFIVIDGIGYKTKYEPCEALNSYANELLNSGTANIILEEPPTLSVVSDETAIGAVLGTYSWQKTNIDGTAESTIADSPHPLECKDLLSPPFETTETTATLRFTEDPDTILSVQCWSDEHWGEPATNSEDVTIVGNVLTLKLGGYIYEVTAEWNTENGYGGTASYFIYLKTAD